MGNSCSAGCGVAGDSDASFTPLPSDPAAFGALTGTALPHLLTRDAAAELAALMKPLQVKAGTMLYGDAAGARAYDGFFVCMSGAVDVDERPSESSTTHQRRVLPGDWFVADVDTAGVARGVSARAVTLESDGAQVDGIAVELLHCSLTDFAQLGVDALAQLTPLLSRAFIAPLLKSVWFLSASPAATHALVAAKARLTVFARGHALYDYSENSGGSDLDTPLFFSLILGGRVRLTAQPVRDEVNPKKSLARSDIPKSRLDAQSARDADMQLEQLLISSAEDEVSVTATKGWYGGTLALLRNVAPLGKAVATDPTLVLCLTRDDLTEALAGAASDADFNAALAELERQRIMQRLLALRMPLFRCMPLEQIEAVIAAGSVCELQPNEHVYREGDDPRLTLVLAGSVQVRVPTTRAQRAASLTAQAVPIAEDEREDDEVATDRDSRIEVGRGVKVENADAHTQRSVVGSGMAALYALI
jgi:CRP-like cAMP-binding protein